MVAGSRELLNWMPSAHLPNQRVSILAPFLVLLPAGTQTRAPTALELARRLAFRFPQPSTAPPCDEQPLLRISKPAYFPYARKVSRAQIHPSATHDAASRA